MLRAPIALALAVVAAALPSAQARGPAPLPSLRPLVAVGAPGAILLTRHGHATAQRALGSGLRAGDSFDPDGDFAGQGYGLGVARFPTRCGVAWGHNGDTPGYVVYALSSRDGARQALLFVNEDAESLPHGAGRVFIDILTRAYCSTRR